MPNPSTIRWMQARSMTFSQGTTCLPEQMDQIYSYLENRNIDVVPVLDEAMLNADPALDDIGLDLDLDDDSFMKDAEEEEIDLDAVDLLRASEPKTRFVCT